MDAANWANLFYALAHLSARKPPQEVVDPWRRPLGAILHRPARCAPGAHGAGRRERALVAGDARGQRRRAVPGGRRRPVRHSKLSVCDPVSVSKAAWALVGVPSRDRRLQLFSRLSAPVVLRADAFPLGALTMTGYAFAKADHRGADVYEALSAAVVRFPDEDLRPIDVCNIIWAFCTVGFRDDELFTRLCTGHLLREDSVARFNAQDITNIMWGFCKVVFMHGDAMAELARGSLKIHDQFKPIHHANLLYSFATLTLRGPAGFLGAMADSALARVDGFDCGNLAIAAWALARLQVHHPLMDSIHRVALRPDVCGSFTSRSLSMLFLAFFCADRARHVDAVLDAALGSGAPVGASGWSAALMTAEQGQDPDREWRFLRAFAEEVQDERMQAAICNSHAIRLLKRSGPEDALRHLSAVRPSGVRCWSAVSECMRARLWRASPGHGDEVPNPAHLLEAWEGPVKSGIHPLAATRQNEGPHAYAREFMTLHAVLGSAPAGDVDACMRAVEDFAEARSLWLKITAWEKAIVVHEAARQARPRLVLEIGAYVGYSAMNLGRAVRPHGGRVVSLEVDPIHVTVVRNMVEYAGLTDTVDVWTGYCSDVFPHLVGRYGPRSIGMVFMDQKGTRFHHDLRLLEELGLLEDGAVILADNVLKPTLRGESRSGRVSRGPAAMEGLPVGAQVRLSCGRELSVRAEGLRPAGGAAGTLVVGARVVLAGLAKAPSLNGREGTVGGPGEAGSGRFLVAVDGEPGPAKALKAENLVLAVAEPAPEEPAAAEGPPQAPVDPFEQARRKLVAFVARTDLPCWQPRRDWRTRRGEGEEQHW
ncbi:unnamed protein product [Prorocentrum cordatum]|uniref:catechol O-methyltransferase n=1 Tax=Prorocentrum cordatum TaxID=2364126 RepID=A0ABN9S9L1_9DINO|nr:unnamed protein product [Polarella glacialis]